MRTDSSTSFFPFIAIVGNLAVFGLLGFLASQPIAWSWCILPSSPPNGGMLILAMFPLANLLALLVKVAPVRALHRSLRMLNLALAVFASTAAGGVVQAMYEFSESQAMATHLGLSLLITAAALAFNPAMDLLLAAGRRA